MARTKRNDKRDRLISAASQLIYEKTFHTTTLADIAKLADVPLGNVYYYFKTKEAIMMAVISLRSQELVDQFAEYDALVSPAERLHAFVAKFVEPAETLARFGCPIGSLCQELGKQGGPISDAASKLLLEQVNWVKSQLGQLGLDNAQLRAEQFIGVLQGLALMTLAFKDPEYLARQSKHLLAETLATVAA